jgi:hypothetical protein
MPQFSFQQAGGSIAIATSQRLYGVKNAGLLLRLAGHSSVFYRLGP